MRDATLNTSSDPTDHKNQKFHYYFIQLTTENIFKFISIFGATDSENMVKSVEF